MVQRRPSQWCVANAFAKVVQRLSSNMARPCNRKWSIGPPNPERTGALIANSCNSPENRKAVSIAGNCPVRRRIGRKIASVVISENARFQRLPQNSKH